MVVVRYTRLNKRFPAFNFFIRVAPKRLLVSVFRRVREFSATCSSFSTLWRLRETQEYTLPSCINTWRIPSVRFCLKPKQNPHPSMFASNRHVSSPPEPEHYLPRHRDPFPRWRRACGAQFSKRQHRRGPLRRVSSETRRYLASIFLSNPCRRAESNVRRTSLRDRPEVGPEFVLPPLYVEKDQAIWRVLIERGGTVVCFGIVPSLLGRESAAS